MSDTVDVYDNACGIPVQCFTNLDDYGRCEWPTQMACRPMVGDAVEAKDGKTLKVVRVTHRQRPDGLPVLRVELHR